MTWQRLNTFPRCRVYDDDFSSAKMIIWWGITDTLCHFTGVSSFCPKSHWSHPCVIGIQVWSWICFFWHQKLCNNFLSLDWWLIWTLSNSKSFLPHQTLAENNLRWIIGRRKLEQTRQETVSRVWNDAGLPITGRKSTRPLSSCPRTAPLIILIQQHILELLDPVSLSSSTDGQLFSGRCVWTDWIRRGGAAPPPGCQSPSSSTPTSSEFQTWGINFSSVPIPSLSKSCQSHKAVSWTSTYVEEVFAACTYVCMCWE